MPSRGPTKGSLEIILVGIPEMYYDTLKAGLFSQNIHVLKGRGHAFCKSGIPYDDIFVCESSNDMHFFQHFQEPLTLAICSEF